MKIIKVFLIGALLALAAFCTSVHAYAANVMGDINSDGEIDICDVMLSVKYITENNPKADAKIADVNLDGVVNILDAVHLLKYVAGHSVELPSQNAETVSKERLSNWKYTLNAEEKIIQLDKYIGAEPIVYVPASFTVDAIEYRTMVISKRSTQRSTFDGSQIIQSIFFEEGVLANEMSYMFKECPNLKYINRYPEYDGVWWVGVFVYCKNLIYAPQIPNIDDIRISSFFSRCEDLIGNYPLPDNYNKNYATNVFYNCKNVNKSTNIVWFGDSITAGTSTEGFSFADYLCEDLKDVGIGNAAVGGRTLSYGYDWQTSAVQTSIVFDLDCFGVMPDVDYVFVSAGTNDFAHRSSRRPCGTYRFADIGNVDDRSPNTLLGAFNTVVSEIREKFPNATLIYTTPITRCDYDVEGAKAVDSTVYTVHLKDFVDGLKLACKAQGVTCFDAYLESGMDVSTDPLDGSGDYFSDETHPTLKGQRKLADYFIEKLVTLYGFEKAE